MIRAFTSYQCLMAILLFACLALKYIDRPVAAAMCVAAVLLAAWILKNHRKWVV